MNGTKRGITGRRYVFFMTLHIRIDRQAIYEWLSTDMPRMIIMRNTGNIVDISQLQYMLEKAKCTICKVVF